MIEQHINSTENLIDDVETVHESDDPEPIGPVDQAAAIPYRFARNGQVEVLLVTAGNGDWSIPKGHVDPGNTHRQTAHIETYEEAGVMGSLHEDFLGVFHYHKASRGYDCRVEVYALHVTEQLLDYPERGRRHREWVSLEEATERVPREDIIDLLRQFGDLMDA